MKWYFKNVPKEGQQQTEKPDVQRRVRMAPHLDHIAQEDIPRVIRVRRVNLRVLSPVQVINVVALNCLVQKRQTQREYEQDYERELYRGRF